MFMAFALNPAGTLIFATPWSSSLVNTPEPSGFFAVGSRAIRSTEAEKGDVVGLRLNHVSRRGSAAARAVANL